MVAFRRRPGVPRVVRAGEGARSEVVVDGGG